MSRWTRRAVLAGAGAFAAGCTPGIGNSRQPRIDQEVAHGFTRLYREVGGAQELSARAAGALMIPRVTEAALLVGGYSGQGALVINDASVDNFEVVGASFGLQIGGQQFGQALFFMTPEALAGFRRRDGWTLGVDAEVATPQDGGAFAGVDTNTLTEPVVELVFSQQGLLGGLSLDGAKYSRIIP